MGLKHLSNNNNSINGSPINKPQVYMEKNPSKRIMGNTDNVWKKLCLEGRLNETHALFSMKQIFTSIAFSTTTFNVET